ncbi:MAG: OmpH family outer membrane protein [Bacteroidales bacterium]|nr:OmpH family outer membrane protein [Bacteroidales bacterium]
MKLRLLIFIMLLLATSSVEAQKYACVNTDYVLKSLPEYASAQKRLDRYVADWQQELTDKVAELDAMRAEYEQESYLLPENLKKRRQEEIREKEGEIRALQQQHFGSGGDLDKRRAELLKPIQDRVYSIIERIANEKNYAFVFDKAGSATVLFASKKYDISDDVLEQLGVKPGTVSGSNGAEGGKSQGEKDAKGQKSSKSSKESFKPLNPEMRPSSDKGPRNMSTPLGKLR